MTDEIEQWMRDNGVRRIVDMRKGWAVYLNRSDTFGTGETIMLAFADAEARV